MKLNYWNGGKKMKMNNNTSTFSSAIDDVKLSYHYTDTIQKVVDPNAELAEDRYENDYIYSVQETYLEKDGEDKFNHLSFYDIVPKEEEE